MLIKLAAVSFERIRNAGTSIRRNYQHFPSMFHEGAIPGLLPMITGASIGASNARRFNRNHKNQEKKSVGASALKGAAIGAGISIGIGLLGSNIIAGMRRKNRAYNKNNYYSFGKGSEYKSFAQRPASADNMFKTKGFKTKVDAKSFHREMVKKHHPDSGGTTEDMKKVNSHWDEYKSHFEKLASWLNKKASVMISDSHLKGDHRELEEMKASAKEILKKVKEMEKEDSMVKKSMDLSVVTPMAENAAIDSAAKAMNTNALAKRFTRPGIVEMPKFGGSNVVNPSTATFKQYGA